MGFSSFFALCGLQDAKRYKASKDSVSIDNASLSSKFTTRKEESRSTTNKVQLFPSILKCESPTPPYLPTASYHDALIVSSKSRYEVVKLISPECSDDDDVVISTRTVGLNPIDWKSVDFGICLPEFPWVTGRELAGVVEKVGKGVTSISPGDRVWTSTYYKKREAGCFQRTVKVPQHTVVPLPLNLDFDGAACLGVAGLTAAMTLWHWMEVPITRSYLGMTEKDNDNSGDNFVLIWGGSTITGQFATQIAVHSGLTVIAITSVKNEGLLRDLGAKHVITRNGKTGKEIVDEVLKITGDSLTKAIDIVGPETALFAMSALSPSKASVIAPLSFLPQNSTIPENVVAKNIEMKKFILDPQCRKYAIELNCLIEQGKIRIPFVEILEGGLDAIPLGLGRLKKGDMEGRKMVVRV